MYNKSEIITIRWQKSLALVTRLIYGEQVDFVVPHIHSPRTHSFTQAEISVSSTIRQIIIITKIVTKTPFHRDADKILNSKDALNHTHTRQKIRVFSSGPSGETVIV